MVSTRTHVLAFVLLSVPAGAVGTARQTESVAGLSREEALRLGERMYRDGILPSGEPMRAIVEGDIPVEGTMFSCASCHLRSGVGAIEGTVVTLPTNAGWLYQPYQGARMSPTSRERMPSYLGREPSRPPYTDESLSRALRMGRDPSGRVLDPVMPRYLLRGTDMDLMVLYLKNLSAVPSPGVTDTTLEFATVITEDVGPADREAFLKTLRAHIEATNSQSRYQERRAREGPWYKEEKFTAYRRLSLSVWELKGPPETWVMQLEDYYRKEPVFALLSGVSSRDWRPIHEFCETNEIPNLLPITDFPVVSETDWYTLYFSKGWYQEGETAAKYIRGLEDLPAGTPIVQVYRDEPVGRSLARGFRETREKLGRPAVEERVLAASESPSESFWTDLVEQRNEGILLFWLDADEIAAVKVLAASPNPPRMIFVSGRRLADRLGSVPEEVRPFTYVTYPYSLPGEKPRAELSARQWLKARKIPLSNERLQSQMYFVGWMLAGILKMMRHDFYRDYFLDEVDMMRDQYYSIATYRRLSFGPGQRYASKGCYIVQLSGGPEPELITKSGWVVH